MLEIDGEFFIDQCKEAKNKKDIAIVDFIIDQAKILLDIMASDNKQSSSIRLLMWMDLFKIELDLLCGQPLYPYKGGAVMTIHDESGIDIKPIILDVDNNILNITTIETGTMIDKALKNKGIDIENS